LIWEKRNWNKERWDNDDPCRMSVDRATPEDYKPIVVDMDVPELNALDMETLKKFDTSIRSVDGYGSSEELMGEDFTAKKPLRDFVVDVENGVADFYIHLEESMYEKRWLNEAIGKTVIRSLLQAVRRTMFCARTAYGSLIGMTWTRTATIGPCFSVPMGQRRTCITIQTSSTFCTLYPGERDSS